MERSIDEKFEVHYLNCTYEFYVGNIIFYAMLISILQNIRFEDLLFYHIVDHMLMYINDYFDAAELESI